MRLIRNMQQMSLQAKLIVLIIVFMCVPFLALGFLWYEISTKSIEQNAIHANKQLVSQINGRLEAYFADLQNITYPLVTHPLIQNFLRIDPGVPYDFVENRRKISEEILPTLFFGRTDIFGFSLVSPNDILTFEVNGNASYRMKEREDNRRIYEAEKDAGGSRYKILGIRRVSTQTGPDELVLTVIRRFSDTRTYSKDGLLVIDLELDRIAGIAQNLQTGSQGYVWIMDSRGEVVHHPDRQLRGQAVADAYLKEFELHRQEGVYLKNDGGKEKLVVFHRSGENDWTMVSEVPLSELIGDLIHLRNLTLWGGSGLVVFVLLVLTVFSFSLTRSLSLLQRLMKKAESGDLMVKAPENRQDEIGGLNRSFNRMVSEIRMLIEVVHAANLREKEMEIKQREATMRALQSQINPHFLYNTLEVINSYAILEGVVPISKMATSLADVFRYSIGNPHEQVTLLAELEHMSAYFDILLERYPYLEVDDQTAKEEAARVRTVRLVIQPLVENAFKHGYEKHRMRLGYIGFREECGPEWYTLRIIDRGKGMDSEQMEAYNRQFSVAGPAGDAEGRIGLWNVHQRIRLAFGSPYGLHIEKSDAEGTVIQVRLPYGDR